MTEEIGGEKIYHHVGFVLLIIAFLVFKAKYVSVPYFWDEVAVYGRSIAYQYNHTLSLMPSSLDPELSRGHPLLFTVIGATVMRIFGENIIVAHVFALCISVLLLLSVYFKLSKYFDRDIGFVSISLLAMQPLFLAQSGLLLPEIMLALLFFMALANYYEQKYFQFAIYASLAVLTKESAVLLPIAALTYSTWKCIFSKSGYVGIYLINILLTLLPCLIFGIFIFIQKQQLGWYLFPSHMDAFHCTIPFFDTSVKGSGYLPIVAWNQQRYFITLIILFALFRFIFQRKKPYNNFVPPLLIFGFVYLSFLAVSDLLFDRYTIAVLVLFSILGGVSLLSISRNKSFVYGILVFLGLIAFRNLDTLVIKKDTKFIGGKFNLDSDLSYARRAEIIRYAVHFAEEVSKPGDGVIGTYPVNYAYMFPEAGYLSVHHHLKWGLTREGCLPEFYINDIMPRSDGPPDSKSDPEYIDTSVYKQILLKRFTDKDNIVEVLRITRK